MFAYSHHVAVEKNGFVIHTCVIPGNVHDSVSFFPVIKDLKQEHSNKGIKNLVLDAAYFTPAICRDIIHLEWIPLMPYVRPRTKKGFFKKYDYVYDEYYDCYICSITKFLPIILLIGKDINIINLKRMFVRNA